MRTHNLDSIALRSDSAEGKRVWIELARTGSFRGHGSGPFTLDAKVFSEIVANFKADGLPIAIDFEHASESDPTEGNIPTHGAPAQGWIHDVRVRGNALEGHVEWGALARDYIKEGKYKYFSPAIRFNARDRVTGKPIGARLSSGALTNSPFLRDLAPLMAASGRDIDPAIVVGEPFARTVTKLMRSGGLSYDHASNLAAKVRRIASSAPRAPASADALSSPAGNPPIPSGGSHRDGGDEAA